MCRQVVIRALQELQFRAALVDRNPSDASRFVGVNCGLLDAFSEHYPATQIKLSTRECVLSRLHTCKLSIDQGLKGTCVEWRKINQRLWHFGISARHTLGNHLFAFPLPK